MPSLTRRTAVRAAISAVASGAALATAPGAQASLAAPRVVVAVRPEPSIRVLRGGALTYQLEVRNTSKDPAVNLAVELPYNPQQLALQDSAFADEGDWVSGRGPGRVVVTFGRVRPSSSRSARITFRVSDQLADDTVIGMRPSYSWRRPGDAGGSAVSNWAPVLVGPGGAHAPHVWAIATPDIVGPRARLRLFSDRFLPGEELALWLNTPGGARALSVRPRADASGAVNVEYQADLGSGAYSVVLQGASSGLTGVAGFVVQ